MVKQHPGESRKEWLMHMFKYFGKGNPANEVFQFWENGSRPIELNSPEILRQKMDYIHMNPVKAGFAEKPWHWKYSSAYEFSEVRVLPV
jgi:putative transposase